MKVTVIGCSPAWPNPGSAQSGYLVEGPGRLLLDCGPGVVARLREREHWPALDAIAVSHLHLDHVGDLVSWTWGALMGPGRGVRLPQLWLPPGGTGDLLDMVDRAPEAFDILEYAEGEPFDVAGFTITARPVAHPARAHALRVTDGERTLVYSGDTEATPALAELARGADLLLCEATLAESGPMHLTAHDAREAADTAGVKRLVLVHRPSELAPDGCDVAYDGLELEL